MLRKAIPSCVSWDQLEQRATERFPMALPGTVRMGDEEYGARIHNLAPGGAMIETAAPGLVGSLLTLSCGTITAGAAVVWRRDGRLGVGFGVPLTESQVSEQVSRSIAIASRRESKGRL